MAQPVQISIVEIVVSPMAELLMPAEWTDVAELVGKHGPLSPERSLKIIRQVTYSLEHARQKGLVNCQVSPETLLVRSDGRVKLAGLGSNDNGRGDNVDPSIARPASSTKIGDYMAPEQAGGSQAADVRSEIYSLGCTWYFMLTGQPPSPVGSLTYELREDSQSPLPAPRSLNAEVSEGILGVLRKMTAKQPSQRHQTLKELLADLSTTSPVSNATVVRPLAEPAPAEVHTEQAACVEDAVEVEVEDESEEIEPVEEPQQSGRDSKRSKSPPTAVADEKGTLSEDVLAAVPRSKRNQSLDTERPKRNYTPLFYLGFGSVLFCIAIGIVLLVQEFHTSFRSAEGERMGNPFAPRDAVAKKGGNAAPNPEEVANSSIGGNDLPADAFSSGTETEKVGTISNNIIGGKINSPQTEARLKQESSFLPGWVMQSRRNGALITLTVKPDSSGKNLFETLNEALEQVPAEGALIKLAGRGPFPLYPARIADKTRLVIEAENLSGPAPVIVLQVPDDSAVSNFIEVSNTTLELRGIHIVLDGEGLSADPDDALVSAVASDLFLRNCSLSVTDMSDSRMTALKIAGSVARSKSKAGTAPRVLIENTVIRGNRLTTLAINTDRVDLALWNALAWSGKAAAIRFGTAIPSDAQSAWNLRMASTTLCSLNCAVQIAGNASQPVRTSIELLNSLLASPAGGKGSSLLVMEGWNEIQQEAAAGTQITWKSTASLYTGWTKLIQLNSADRSVATSSPADWLATWQDESSDETATIQATFWPDLPIADIERAGYEALSPQTIGQQYVKTDEGGWPGCQTEQLPPAAMKVQRTEPAKVKRPTGRLPPSQ